MSDFTSHTKGHPWFVSTKTKGGIEIDFLSFIPLYLESYFVMEDGTSESLSSGTGYVVKFEEEDYLITNWHIVSGLNAENGNVLLDRNGRKPNFIKVWNHHETTLHEWVIKDLSLYCEPNLHLDEQWLSHPDGYKVDVVAIQIQDKEGIKLHSLDVSQSGNDLLISPSDSVSIIGYPEGKSAGGKFPIWKTGHISSDLELHKYKFYIDATTKPGMSGSPVFAKRTGAYFTGFNTVSNGAKIRFLGTYSGRLSNTIDIGNVWHPSVIEEIISNAKSK